MVGGEFFPMPLNGKKICLHSLGCRTNQSELESIASGLVENGAIVGNEPEDCDAAVLMTCSVTATADKKSRQFTRMIRRKIPDGLLVACGCWAQRLSNDEAKELGIDYVIPNRRKGCVLGLIKAHLCGESLDKKNDSEWDNLPHLRPTLRSRAFVKIQDGCDHFCTYCIVPYLRGKPVSRPLEDVMSEISSVSESGCNEIILTGTNLGRYKCGLDNLVRRIAKLPVTLQFGSIEPFSIDDELLTAIAEMGDRFIPPLHIPLQSGDDEVLRRMGRGYTRGEYLSKIERVKEILGDIPFNTDLLVGFPGESEEAFQHSLDVIRSVGFAHVHIFPFSPREGTRAAAFDSQLPRSVILDRARRAKEVCN